MVLAGGLFSSATFAAENSPSEAAHSNRQSSITNHRQVVVIVWDGMRPDFVTEQIAPTLYQLARRGVTFANHHSVYLSSTEVNGTTLFTGAYPAHNGIIGNREYRPEIDSLKVLDTQSLAAVRKGDELTGGHYVSVPTVAEIVRQAGRKAVVAGAKPVVLLADRAPRTSWAAGANVFAGSTLPPNLLEVITNRYRGFPADNGTNPTRNAWTTSALIDPLWAEGVPAFSLLWMNEPDLSQHRTGPGSKQSLAAIRNADENLASVLKALDAKGARDATDIIVVSDHGFSTILATVDLAESLGKAGLKASREFKTKPSRGDILVVSNGGSSLIYVVGHDDGVIAQVVRFLRRWEFTGVIFTRQPMPGTFALSQVHLDSAAAPDVVVSLRWTTEKNQAGTPGMVAADVPGLAAGQGAHVSLSSFDLHNTLVAAGPDFRSGVVDTLASGNVDVAPTVLWILGIKPPKPMDGRVLTEALTIAGPGIKSFEPRHIETTCGQEGVAWHQYLNFTEVNGVVYYDEGNGHQSSR